MSITRERPVFASSELSRNAAEVFAEAESQPVTVTRRGGESLVLMTKVEADEKSELLNFAAQLIAVITDDRGTLVERMMVQFPWIYALNETERQQCVQELIHAARASFSTGQPHLVAMEFISWRETAANYAAGIAPQATEWLDASNELDGHDIWEETKPFLAPSEKLNTQSRPAQLALKKAGATSRLPIETSSLTRGNT